MPYTGRLAPSPTGRLHLGNLSTSLLAWVAARAAGGRLVLRIEDLDPPRTVDGATVDILDDLRWLGVTWDEGPAGATPDAYFQSQRTAHYEAAIAQLADAGLVYACGCSRREVREVLSAPHGRFDPRLRYPGTCAEKGLPLDGGYALRFRAQGVQRGIDRVHGPIEADVSVDPGDFVVRRADGLYAYHLAVVVDDIAMGVTDVVRGYDLLAVTPQQLALYRALGATPPTYLHAPLIMDHDGGRLSKRRGDVDRRGLERDGWTPATLRGRFAQLWGWTSELRPLSGDELVALWRPETLAVPELLGF